MLESDYVEAGPSKIPPPLPVRVSRRSQLVAALRQRARPIVIEDQELARPFVRLLRARQLRVWAFGGVADTMSVSIARSYGSDIEAQWYMGRYVLPGNVDKIILKPMQSRLRTPTRAMCSSRDVENQLPQRQVTSDDLHLMKHAMQALMRIAFLVLVFVLWGTESSLAQATPPSPSTPPSHGGQYSSNEVINAGHRFFGTVSQELAEIVEKAGSQWGLPNGYVLGQEAGGAWVAGLRYGEGMLYTKNAGDRRVYWQGPSLGFDFGGDGARTMMLVYDLPDTDAIYQRFVGIDGSAYFVGGLGMTALSFNNIVVVPVRSGVGLRLGANVGYLKFTPTSTWNPF